MLMHEGVEGGEEVGHGAASGRRSARGGGQHFAHVMGDCLYGHGFLQIRGVRVQHVVAPAPRAAHEVRAGDQPQDRQGARPDDPAVAPAAGGSGDRMSHPDLLVAEAEEREARERAKRAEEDRESREQ
jgi:hypothetical protein